MCIITEYSDEPEKIVEKLRVKVPFFKTLLADTEKWILAKHSCSTYVRAVMKNYKDHFAAHLTKDDHLVIYMLLALRGIGREAVFNLFKKKFHATDLRYLEVINRLIMESYGGDLLNFFNSAYEFNLAYEIVGRDPIGRYLAGKKTLSDAAVDIQNISVKTSVDKMNIGTVFSYMYICYQCEMTIYTLADIEKGLPSVQGGFGITDTIGEIPEGLFESLFKLDEGKCVWVSSPFFGYRFTGSAMDKLSLLYNAVIDLDGQTVSETGLKTKLPKLQSPIKPVKKKSVLEKSEVEIKKNIVEHYSMLKKHLRKSTFLKPPGKGPGRSPITQRQYRYLRSLPNYSFMLEYGNTNVTLQKQLKPAIEATKKLVERIEKFLKVPKKTAETVARTCVQYLEEKAPITLAVQSTFPFDKAKGKILQDIDLTQETIEVQKVIGKGEPMKYNLKKGVTKPSLKLAYVHKEDHERGEHYMRWRRKKEEEMTKHHQFYPSEYAIYAAVDLIVEYMDHPDGPAYFYGPHHFLLANDMKTRSTFTLGADDMEATRSMVDMANRLPDDLFTMMLLRAYGINGIKTSCTSLFPFFEIQMYGDVRFKEDVIHFMECTKFKSKELDVGQKNARQKFATREKVALMTYNGMESYKKKSVIQPVTLTGVDISKKIGVYKLTKKEKLKKFFGFKV